MKYSMIAALNNYKLLGGRSLEMMKNMDPEMMSQLSKQSGMSSNGLPGMLLFIYIYFLIEYHTQRHNMYVRRLSEENVTPNVSPLGLADVMQVSCKRDAGENETS